MRFQHYELGQIYSHLEGLVTEVHFLPVLAESVGPRALALER